MGARWALSLLGGALAAAAGSEIAVRTVASGHQSGIREARQVVARTPAEWEALWREHSRQPAPELDLDEVMAVGIFLGTRPTGGYAVEVKAVRKDDGGLVVEYAERRPSPDAMVTQALTAPFQIVGLPRHEGEVRFRRVGTAPRRRDGARPPEVER